MPTSATAATTASTSATTSRRKRSAGPVESNLPLRPTHACYPDENRIRLAANVADMLISGPYGTTDTPTSPPGPWHAYADKGDILLLLAHAVRNAEETFASIRTDINNRGTDEAMRLRALFS